MTRYWKQIRPDHVALEWRCPNCPRQVERISPALIHLTLIPHCPICDTPMVYDRVLVRVKGPAN